MARIIKSRARKPIAEASISVGMSNFKEDGGLRFTISIDHYKVSLTHLEKDHLIEIWNKMQKEWEQG